MVTMMHLLVTVLYMAIPYFLMFGVILHEWNNRQRGLRELAVIVGLTVLAVLFWQAAWHESAGAFT